MIGLNLYAFVKTRCKNPDCAEMISQYPCASCGFNPAKPKDSKISEGYQT